MMLYIVDECPRDYHIGFLVKKGWPFRTRFNRILMILFEAGNFENISKFSIVFDFLV